MLSVTQSAAQKFIEMINKNGSSENTMLRISFGGHG